MADRSKNEQYDIVSQAEEVLELYIKRYFDTKRRRRSGHYKNHLSKKSAVLSFIVASVTIGAFVYLLTHFL